MTKRGARRAGTFSRPQISCDAIHRRPAHRNLKSDRGDFAEHRREREHAECPEDESCGENHRPVSERGDQRLPTRRVHAFTGSGFMSRQRLSSPTGRPPPSPDQDRRPRAARQRIPPTDHRHHRTRPPPCRRRDGEIARHADDRVRTQIATILQVRALARPTAVPPRLNSRRSASPFRARSATSSGGLKSIPGYRLPPLTMTSQHQWLRGCDFGFGHRTLLGNDVLPKKPTGRKSVPYGQAACTASSKAARVASSASMIEA